MAQNNVAVRKPPVVERRPALATIPHGSAAAASVSPAQALQRRLGNQATQGLLAQAIAASPRGTTAVDPRGTTSAAAPAQAPRAREIPRQAKGQSGAAPHSAPRGHGVEPKTANAPRSPRERATQSASPTSATSPGKNATDKEHAASAAPNARQAIGPAVTAVGQRAAVSKQHTPAPTAVGFAQASAIQPHVEQTRGAAVQTVAGLDAAKPEAVRRNEFKAKLKKAIVEATPAPKTEAEGSRLMKEGGKQASASLKGDLAAERDAAAGPMKSAAATEAPPALPAPPETKLQVQPPGSPPAPISAAPVVPASLPAERLDYSADRGPTDQAMAQNDVTQDQLKKGNDPAFGPTLDARSTAEKHEASAEGRYRQQEDKVQGDAQAKAAAALDQGLGGIHAGRVAQFGKVGEKQHGTAAKDAAKRQELTDKINGIKNETRSKVDGLLREMDDEAPKIFGRGLERAESAYEAAFDDAKGGLGNWLTNWGDDWEKLIANALVTARAKYMQQVDVAIDEVADFVDKKLNEAKECVAAGRKQIDEIVKGLDGSLKQFGEEAREAVIGNFDAMTSQIDEHRDALVNKLTDQYKASYERMSAREEELRNANKSLWQRVYDATVGLIVKIIAFKDMLLGLLGRVAGVVNDIIHDPIGFLGNLVSGVMSGLKNFMSNIGSHLKKGLMDWLFGALAGAGLQLPDAFDLKGILSIVLQILGLTYANFRARAVTIVGEPLIGALEKGAEVFKVFLTEGVGGLWRFIKEKVSDLKSMVLDAIFDFIKEKVIIAGVTWIIGLLNPASAFFKACKAIYDIVMFFINRGSQILSLVNAIVDSMASIVKGNISVAASFVENTLAKAIPVAIGFLASLLGLGDPSKPVKATIEKAQSPVNKAIDWVIHGAVKLVQAAGKFIGKVFGKDKDDVKQGSGVKAKASSLLVARIGKKAKVNSIQTAANFVLEQLRPEGLKRLEVKRSRDKLSILAEASPIDEILAMIPDDKKEAVAVTLAAIIKLKGGAPVIQGVSPRPLKRGTDPMNLKEEKVTPFVKPVPGPDVAPKGTPREDREGQDRAAGAYSTRPDTNEIYVVTYNTGHPKGGDDNSSHAERQFVEWFNDNAPEWRSRVERIDIRISMSPCKNCGPTLVQIKFKGDKFLVYEEVHHTTTPKIIDMLQKEGFKVKGATENMAGNNEDEFVSKL